MRRRSCANIFGLVNLLRYFPLGLHRFVVRLALVLALAGAVAGARAQDGVVNECTQAELETELAFGGDIVFDCDGVIVLTNTLVISTDTTLDATGHFIVISTISGTNATNAVRLFEVEPEVSFTLINMRLSEGRSTNGAAVFNNGGNLVAVSCVFSNNQALGFNGRFGVNGRNSSDSYGRDGGNAFAGTSAAGGAIYNLGAAFFANCAFLTNAAAGGIGGDGGNGGDGAFLGGAGGRGGKGGSAYGGSIFNEGALFLSECAFYLNFVLGGDGGAGGVGGTSRAYTGYNGRGAAGGAAQGGAVYNTSKGIVEIVASTFALNQAQGANSADGGTGTGNMPNGWAGGEGLGGAICNFGTNVMENSTFFANAVLGGAGGSGYVGRFQGTKGGNGGTALGGAVYNFRRTLATNCTFSDGGAIGGTNGAGGESAYPGKNGKPGLARGGNVANARGQFFLKNCVIAYGAPGTNGYGVFVNSGYNISSDRSIVLRGGGSLVNTNPALGILDDNGGPTQTIALGEGSPAINAGDPKFTLPTDQRGVPRPQGTRSDIGAYEYGLFLVPPTVVSQPRDAQVQVGGTVSFSVVAQGDPPLLYQWRHNGANLGGETESTLTITDADTTDGGTYDVVVSNNSGSVTSEAATLRVLRPVSITDQPLEQVVTPGGTANFSVTASGDGLLSFQWFHQGSPILGATLSTLTLVNVETAQKGDYQVLVANSFSFVLSDPATLTVATTPPIITEQPSSLTVGTGDDAIISVVATGGEPLSYQWFYNVVNPLIEGTNATLVIPNAQQSNAGFYHVTVVNPIGSVSSAPAVLQVGDVAAGIRVQPESVITNSGARVTFSVVASGSRPVTYQWVLDGLVDIVDATNSTFTLENVTTEDVGAYTVVVSNAFGSEESYAAYLDIDDSAFAPAGFSPAAVVAPANTRRQSRPRRRPRGN